MSLTIARETTPLGGTVFPGADGKVYERWRITGDGTGGNADFALGGGRKAKSVKLISGNISLDDVLYAVTLDYSSTVDVRIAVPSTLAADKYFFADIECRSV